MKSLSLFVSAAALLSVSSAFALDCGVVPSCESLGFSQSKNECPDKYQICPFDKNKVVCIDEPSVGDVKHSLLSANHDGWLLCNGQEVSRTQYSQLYNLIGTKFGSGNNSTTFNVPDYRGFFLRAAGTNINFNLCKNDTDDVACTGSVTATYNTTIYNTPQKEQLPNITGEFPLDTNAGNSGRVSDAFTVNKNVSGTWSGSGTGSGCIITFNASNTPGTGANIYKDNGHVTPPNYATHIFIYAGQ